MSLFPEPPSYGRLTGIWSLCACVALHWVVLISRFPGFYCKSWFLLANFLLVCKRDLQQEVILGLCSYASCNSRYLRPKHNWFYQRFITMLTDIHLKVRKVLRNVVLFSRSPASTAKHGFHWLISRSFGIGSYVGSENWYWVTILLS